ncbi:MAG TPA: serine protease [Myxococcales bacterium]|nr:serine protease [Myxococcales bacterium]
MLALLLAAVVMPSDPQAALKSVADRVHSAVIEVRAEAAVVVPGDAGDTLVPTATFGAGVLVGNGLAVTTLHTVGMVAPGKFAPWKNIEVLLPRHGVVSGELLGWYPEYDLAVLRVPDAVDAPPALATELPAPGAPLLAMGADDQAVNVVGVQLAGVSGDVLLLTSVHAVDSRYWGGPVFDAQGRLAGITLPAVMPRALSSVALASLLQHLHDP